MTSTFIVAVLGAGPPEAPVVLADASLLTAVEECLTASLPAGEALLRVLDARDAVAVRGGWCLRAASPAARADAEQRLYADLGSPIDTRLDRMVHRPLSRHLTRIAVALGLSPNAISLANLALGLFGASCLAMATVGTTLIGIVIYFASAVLDHVDGEVARLTYAESRLGEWLDVAVDNVVHASIAIAMGLAAGRVAGTGLALGVVMVIEALGMLAIGWRAFGLATHDEALHTFTFQTLFYFALFSIVSIRERRRFWASRPSGILAAALLLDALVGTAVSMTGIPGLAPLPWAQTAVVFGYAMMCCLLVNDPLKVALIRRVGWQG